MKQKINVPMAIVIIVVVVVALCAGLYRRFMYQPTYSVEDIAAKFRAAGSKTQAPPNMQQHPQPGK